MMDVHFAGMPRHRFGKPEDVSATRAQEGEPQPDVSRELGVVPREPADVVAPRVAVGVVRVHHIAIVPEAVPASLVLLAMVEIEHPAEAAFDLLELRCRGRRRREGSAEYAGFVQCLRRGNDDSWRAQRVRKLGEACSLRSCAQYPEHHLTRARNAERCAEARFVVLVRDLEAFALAFVCVLTHAVVIEAQVHGLCGRRPEPQSDFGCIAHCVSNIELRGMALPAVSNAEGDAARRPANVGQARCATAAIRVQPAVAVSCSLANHERIGSCLQQSPVAECGNQIEIVFHSRRDRRHGMPGDLRGACTGARVAAQAGEAAYGFTEHAIVLAGEADVPIVQRVCQRRCEAQADAPDEIARFIAVEDERVQHAQRVAAGI